MSRGKNKNNSGSGKKGGKNTNSGKNIKLDVVNSDSDSNDSLYEDACPCNLSDTTSWKLVCTKCDQTWHSSCANIKGIPEQFITSLELWLCPWCFIVPFRKPQSYFTETVIEADGSTIYNFSKEFQKLSNDVTKTVSDSNTNVQNKLVDLDSKFNDLSTKLNNLEAFKNEMLTEQVHQSPPHSVPPSDTEPSPLQNVVNDHNESHIDNTNEQFIDAESCDKLIDYFKDCEFSSENGHSVMSFGEEYRYNGSKSKPSNIPVILNSLIDKINNQFDLPDKINSCLVNKFSGPDSFLKEHSDDEMIIHPESSIYTISLGDTRTISFRELNSGNQFEHKPSNGSLYTMTRKSQNYYKHEICKDELFTGVRYSITFRVVHWRYWNSTCIIGDSNTRGLMFGTEGATFGPSTPGKKFFAPTVENINPHNCVAYNNVVIMCGINNIKVGSVRDQSNIRNIYRLLKAKIDIISKLNSKAKIFICPILPTKSTELNNKALFFNHLIFKDLVMCNYGVSVVHGFNEFLDPAGTLLSRNLSRPQMHDLLHLNETGTKLLADKIKTSIFQRKKRRSGVVSDRAYAKAVQQGARPG